LKSYLIILICVLAFFGAIVLLTGFLGNHFGKPVEMVVLIITAIILLVLYIQSKRS